MPDTENPKPATDSSHVLFDLFTPALLRLVNIETEHYREKDRRFLANLPPLTGEHMIEFRAALEDFSEQLKPMMMSVLGETTKQKTQAELEGMPSPLVLIEKLPSEFLWLAFTQYLRRCRDELLRIENPQPAGGSLSAGGLAGLLAALQSSGADISLKLVSPKDIEEKGMKQALEDATDLLAEPPNDTEEFPKED